MEARFMEGKIKYLKYLVGEDSNDLLRRKRTKQLNRNKDNWIIDIKDYAKELKMAWINIASMKNEKIKKNIKWDLK